MQDFINGKRKKESGFTIIEVVLVLAIAGLIFLIVFLALPQLQKSRRDTQRRGDAGKILSAAESAASNAGGNYPTLANLNTDYVAGEITTPGNTAYTVGTSANVATDAYFYSTNASCGTNGTYTTGGGTRSIAVVMGLEDGRYCQDNQ